MDNHILKEILLDYFGLKEDDLRLDDLSCFCMSLGQAIDIAEIYGDKIKDIYTND